MIEQRKRFALLGAYETLTEKERFCLKEGNFEAIGELQEKKLRLLKDLERLEDASSLAATEKNEFNSRLEKVLAVESENEALLEELKVENRSQYRALSKRFTSASKIRRAYGSASNPNAPRRTLKDQA